MAKVHKPLGWLGLLALMSGCATTPTQAPAALSAAGVTAEAPAAASTETLPPERAIVPEEASASASVYTVQQRGRRGGGGMRGGHRGGGGMRGGGSRMRGGSGRRGGYDRPGRGGSGTRMRGGGAGNRWNYGRRGSYGVWWGHGAWYGRGPRPSWWGRRAYVANRYVFVGGYYYPYYESDTVGYCTPDYGSPYRYENGAYVVYSSGSSVPYVGADTLNCATATIVTVP